MAAHYSIQKLILLGLASYLLGSIPFSFLISKIFKGKDIRNYGSGNVGASNVTRALGPKYGAAALTGDVGKGVLAAILVLQLNSPLYLGAFAILGHIFSPFLNFSGGKGVATSIGVISVFSWKTGLILGAIWLLTLAAWKIASLSSLTALSCSPLFIWIFGEYGSLFYSTIGIALLAFITHRNNIARLLTGEENKI